MRKRVLTGLLLTALPVLCLGQSTESSWDNLKQLQDGQKIDVVDVNLKSLRGKLVRVTDDAISLETKGGKVTLERERVVRVSTVGGGRAKNAALGTVAGAIVGLATGALAGFTYHEGEKMGRIVSVTVALGAGAGAGIGAAFPGSRTIYRAPKRQDTGEGP